jgi:hypothetical protein
MRLVRLLLAFPILGAVFFGGCNNDNEHKADAAVKAADAAARTADAAPRPDAVAADAATHD